MADQKTAPQPATEQAAPTAPATERQVWLPDLPAARRNFYIAVFRGEVSLYRPRQKAAKEQSQ